MIARRAVGLVGIPFLWLGMVAAISLMEAPLKFRAEGVSRTEALAVGQLVFPALNAAELACAVALAVLLWPLRRHPVMARPARLAWAAIGILLLQVVLVRPLLHVSTAAVLAGESEGGSAWHWVYIVLEGAKLVVLVLLAVAMVRAVLTAAADRSPDRPAGAGARGPSPV